MAELAEKMVSQEVGHNLDDEDEEWEDEEEDNSENTRQLPDKYRADKKGK